MFDKLMMGQLKKAQEMFKECMSLEVEGESGAGMVKVRLNGQFEVIAVTLENEALEDKAILSTLIAAAFNDAGNKLKAAYKDKMAQSTPLNFPWSSLFKGEGK